MDKYIELEQRVNQMEERVKQLEDTISAIGEIQASEKIQSLIEGKKRALHVAELLNSVSPDEPLPVMAQQAEIQSLQAEQDRMSKHIDNIFDEIIGNNADDEALAKQFSYHKIEDGMEVDSYIGFNCAEILVIPAKIKGQPVISIGEDAFKNLSMVRVILPDTIYYIGRGAFYSCKKLKNINLPSELEYIESYCFAFTSLEQIVLPNYINRISEGCFYGCMQLRNVVLPNKLKEICSESFFGTALEHIIIPESVSSIHSKAFNTRSNRQILRIAVLGKRTDISDHAIFMAKDVTIYCDSGSVIQNTARRSNIPVKPLSEYHEA